MLIVKCRFKTLFFTTEKVIAAKFPSFKLSHDKLLYKIIEMAIKWRRVGSLNVYWGKLKKCVIVLPFFLKFQHFYYFFFPRLYLEALLRYLMGFFTQVSHPFYTNGSLDILHLPHCMLLTMRQYQDSSKSSFSANVFDFQQKSLFSSGKQVFFYIIFLLVKCSAFFVKIYFLAGFFQTVPHRKLKQSPVGEGRRTALASTKFCNLHFYSRQEGLELVGVCQANRGTKKKKN